MRRVYLDHNATTPLNPGVLEAMLPYFSTEFGNASSIHSYGQQARAAVERARESVAALIGARPAEIVFTSGGTEADNLAILGVVEASPLPHKHLVTTQIEHHAVLNTCQALETRGIEVTYVPVTSAGVVDPDEIRRALRPDTVMVTVMHANNELGTVQPVEEIGRIAAEADVWFHIDAVQSVGKIPANVDECGADLLSLSAHKFYGPMGVGALYVRSGTRMKPLFFGGHHQRDRRPGTENVAGAVGLGKAAELAQAKLTSEPARVARLRDRFEMELESRVTHIRINGKSARRTPNTSNVSFSYIEGESLVIALDLKGLACSTGAACSSGAVEPSHVLTAIGLVPEQARASLRFSLGEGTSEEHVEFALGVIPEAVERLRELSPLFKKQTTAR